VKLQRDISKRTEEELGRRGEAIKLQKEIDHVSKRLESAKFSVEKIKIEYEKQEKEKEDLRRLLSEVTEASKQFEGNLSEIITISFSEEQIAEYNTRKEKAYSTTAKQQQQLNQLTRQQKQDLDARETLKVKRNELQTRLQQLEQTLQQLIERRDKMAAFIEENREKQEQLKKELLEIQQTNLINSERQRTLTGALENVQTQLREAKSETIQNERDIRFAETVDALKRLFPGRVLGRIIDLCTYTQRKYSIALTVAMGSNMDAIVVEDETTATESIQYMKEQRLGTATFIPLDKIRVRPINEKYRMMGDTVKPIIDVILFDPSVQKAILYAVGNTLVCESLDEARKLGFGTRERNKVVTLNGTLIHKSGLMTGGLSGSIEERARRWDEKQIEDLKRTRDRYLRELTEVGRSLRSVDKEQEQSSQIAGFEMRIKYASMDLEKTKENIENNQKEQTMLRKEIQKLEPDLTKLDTAIDNREKHINAVLAEIHQAEDRIFEDFCKEVGVETIREYEENNLTQAKQRAQRKLEFSTQISRLRNQLEYEEKRDLKGPKERSEKQMADDELLLRQLRERERDNKKTDSQVQAEIDRSRKKLEELKSSSDAIETSSKEMKRKLDFLDQEKGKILKQITAQETLIEQLKSRRHSLLQKTKLEEIAMPRKKASEEG